jgi:hypothetical protein
MGLLSAIFGAKPPVGAPPFALPHENTGGAEIPTTPETLPAKRGLAGFVDRLFNPTNPLGQFGQALVASGGGPLGNAMAYMMQQRAVSGKDSRDFANWRQQYDYEVAHPKQTEPRITGRATTARFTRSATMASRSRSITTRRRR